MASEDATSCRPLDDNAPREQMFYASQARKHSTIPIYFPLSDGFESQSYLDVLVDIADALGVDDMSFASYSSTISSLSEEDLSVKRSSLLMRYAEDELSQHLASAQHEEALIRKWTTALQAQPCSESDVPAMERRRTAVRAKAKEYHEELNTLLDKMPEDPPITVSQLAGSHKQLREKEKILAEKRARVAAFQGLPPNIDVARHQLSHAQDEHMKLIQLRERLLDRMASGVA